MSDPTLLGSIRLSGPHHTTFTFAFQPMTTTPPAAPAVLDYATFEAHIGRTIDAMRLYGGGFMTALAGAIARADGRNRRKLFDAFAGEISAYGPGSRFFDATPA